MSQLLKVAFKELGTAEIAGAEDNPRIVEYAKKSGFINVSDDETPWCSIFVNYCCEELGYQKSGKADARSWLKIGTKTSHPKPGDIVVFWREKIDSWKGHVGLFLGFSSDKKKVFCLGGNQGNKVSVAEYDASKVLGFRRVAKEQIIDIPKPILKKGDRGEEVIKLQTLLNTLGYDCGDPDGIFGNKTTNALRLLQANNHIQVDGIYGKQGKNTIESLLQT
ncbi:MAG: TIGR02594 family protein [Cyclobacteriaceae bacterium]|nr:TIGR02594 family protein [Cyclobacteriaceae bacterium]